MIVVGSGPGGLSAAIAAARAGVSVILIERFGCFGGNITSVGVEGFAWYRHENTIEAGGLAFEYEQRAIESNAAVPESQSKSYELDSEGFKVVADNLVLTAGVRPMLHRAFCAPILEGDEIKGVITESKAGREAIIGKIIIDATGDADVARRSGVTVFKNKKEDMISASVMFHMSGVNKEEFMNEIERDPQKYSDWSDKNWQVQTSGKEDDMFSPFLRKPFEKAKDSGLIDSDLQTISGTWGAIHDTGELTYLNLVHLNGIDGTDPESLTKGEIEGRKAALEAITALKEYMPGCSAGKLRNFGMTIGIRDTYKIDSVYNLSDEDVKNECRFEDSVGIYPEFIDGFGVLVLPTTGRYMHIPYRSLLPKNIKGLLVVGRALPTTSNPFIFLGSKDRYGICIYLPVVGSTRTPKPSMNSGYIPTLSSNLHSFLTSSSERLYTESILYVSLIPIVIPKFRNLPAEHPGIYSFKAVIASKAAFLPSISPLVKLSGSVPSIPLR